jgi:hypothetical protein
LGAHWQQGGFLLAGAAAETGLLDEEQTACLFAGVCGRFVKGGCLSGLDREGAGGTHGQAEAGTVTQFLAHYAGLAVHQFDGSLSAGGYTQTTAVTKFFIDANDGTYDFFHGKMAPWS